MQQPGEQNEAIHKLFTQFSSTEIYAKVVLLGQGRKICGLGKRQHLVKKESTCAAKLKVQNWRN